jgi:hypothetical protein
MLSWDDHDHHDEFDKGFKIPPLFHKESPPQDFIGKTLYVDYSQGTSFSHVMTHHDAILGGDPQENQKHR